MTCFSCEWYRYGQTPYCAKARSGFPGIGTACRAFSYEPGADEAERVRSQAARAFGASAGSACYVRLLKKGLTVF